MRAFFSPKSRLQVRRRIAIPLNTMNVLGPVLLILALILLAMAGFGNHPPSLQRWLLARAGILIAVALVIRVVWGIAIFLLKHHRKAP